MPERTEQPVGSDGFAAPDDLTLVSIEEAAVDMARRAAQKVMAAFGTPLDVRYKGAAEPVTELDRRIEEEIAGEILTRFPGHVVLGEEHGLSGDGEWTWVIDPIDGTANFIAGLPTFAVSVGVLQHGRPVVGAIALPAQGALLHARLGGVTRRGSDAVRVAQPAARTRVAVIGAGAHRRLHVAPALLDDLLDTRWLGSTAFEMAMIAQGVFDFGLFDRTAIWDVAAGIVLVRQAGGLVLHPDAGTGTWESFAGFPVDPARLRHWDAPLLAGGPDLQDLGRSVSLR